MRLRPLHTSLLLQEAGRLPSSSLAAGSLHSQLSCVLVSLPKNQLYTGDTSVYTDRRQNIGTTSSETGVPTARQRDTHATISWAYTHTTINRSYTVPFPLTVKRKDIRGSKISVAFLPQQYGVCTHILRGPPRRVPPLPVAGRDVAKLSVDQPRYKTQPTQARTSTKGASTRPGKNPLQSVCATNSFSIRESNACGRQSPSPREPWRKKWRR